MTQGADLADAMLDPRMRAILERAVSLSGCPSDGDCFPDCPHCSASPEEVERALDWLWTHPDEVRAWAREELGGAQGWKLARAHHKQGSLLLASVGTELARTGDVLKEDVVQRIAWVHNQEVERLLLVIDTLLHWGLKGEHTRPPERIELASDLLEAWRRVTGREGEDGPASPPV